MLHMDEDGHGEINERSFQPFFAKQPETWT
jgi:hypothetical protein